MIIYVTRGNAVELREPDDFKNFKILLKRTDMPALDLSRALDGIAVVDVDGKTAWVSQDALKNWGGKPQRTEWVESFDKMINAVKKFGWVDQAKGTVRGHIETAA